MEQSAVLVALQRTSNKAKERVLRLEAGTRGDFERALFDFEVANDAYLRFLYLQWIPPPYINPIRKSERRTED